jgi:hypothetical protein
MTPLQIAAICFLCMVAGTWLACALMVRADRRGEDAPPADIDNPCPITPAQLVLAVIVVALACFASSVWPMGFASTSGG